ncbi:MAG TPA: hypothetical protein VGK29_24505 [Paludibaculum sp.]|jgi:hypothetical protein
MPTTKKTAKPRAPRANKTAAKAAKRAAPCVVCGADVAPFSTEELCWVCRRLKISAWRDTENQSAMQE